MKTIKSMLSAAVVTTTASGTHATVWDITLSSSSSVANIPIIMNLSGIYDDSAIGFDTNLGVNVHGVGNLSGEVDIPSFQAAIHYNSISFVMDPTSGQGYINPPDSSESNCTSSNLAACIGFSPNFDGAWYNDINFSYITTALGQFDSSTGNPFLPVSGANYAWSLVVEILQNGKFVVDQYPYTGTTATNGIPLSIKLISQVPIPATAWLLGSGLYGRGAIKRRAKSA
jgi:hypothetical protein